LTSASSSVEAEIGSAAAAHAKILVSVRDARKNDQFDMNLKLNELDAGIKANDLSYAVTSGGAINKLAAEVESIIPKVEQPVWADLQSTLRRITAKLDAGKIQQVEDLGGLEAKLKEVEVIMARNSGHDETTEVEVPKLQQEADTKIKDLEKILTELAEDRDTLDHNMKQKMAMNILEVENKVGADNREMKTTMSNAVQERTRSLFGQLSGVSRGVKKIDGDRMGQAANTVDAMEFLDSKVTNLETELTNAQVDQNAQIKSVNDKIEEIQGAKTQEMTSIGAKVLFAAKDAINQAVDTSKQKTAAQLITVTSDLNADLAAQAYQVKMKIQAQGKYIRHTMRSNVVAITQATDQARANAEDLRFHAKQATEDAGVILEDLQKGAAKATQDAQRMQMDTDKRVEHSEKDAEALAEITASDTESAMKTASHTITGTREQVDTVLEKGLKELFDGEENVKGKGEGALEKVNSEVSGKGEEVLEEGKEAERVVGQVNEEVAETEETTKNEIDRTDEEAKNEEAGTEDDMKAMGSAFAATADRNGAVVGAMAADAGDLQSERDEAADQIKNSVGAEVKMISTENNAAYTATGGAVKNAAAVNEKSEEQLNEEEKMLWMNATQLDRHRMAYENETKNGLTEFRKILDQETISLDENVGYLDKYERYAHQRELAVVEDTVMLLKSEALGSDKMFDEMEHKERSLGQDIAKLMGGEAFATMKKIMETDMFVQKATTDDEDALTFLDGHEKASTPFMRSVMNSLNSIHEEMVENGEASMHSDKDGEANGAGRTANSVGALAGMVESTGGAMPVDELSAMSDNSADMLRGKAAEGAARDDEMLNDLQGKGNAATGAANDEVQKEKAAFNVAKGESDKIQHKTDGMDNQVQELLNYNEQVMSQERGRLSERANGVTNAMFYKEGPESLMETSAKLTSLLEKNKELSEKNKALDTTQSHLGMQVEDIAKKIADAKQQLRVA